MEVTDTIVPPGAGPWRDWRNKARDVRYLQKMQELLEHRLRYLRGRAERVALIADRLGQGADFDRENLATLALGARYHDLGLLAIPDILLTSDRPLSPEEHHQVDAHIRFGGQLLTVGYPDYPELLEIVWFHHERPDGKGPLGLQGELIPLSAQITSLAGAVESMYQGRPGRPPRSPPEIVEELHRCAGSQFHTTVVRLFSRSHEEIFTDLAGAESVAAAASEQPARGGGGEANVRVGVPSPHRTVSGKGPPASPHQPVNVSTRLSGAQHFTALPTVVCEVLMLAGNKYADRQELTKAIQQDVALTAGVLRVANSSVYGPRRGRICTVEEAVANLGFDAIKNLANSMGIVRNVAGASEGAVSYAQLWEHSFATALIARILSSEDPPPVRDIRYHNALLHDFGKFALAEHFAEQVPLLMQTRTFEEERTIIEVDHAALGAKILSGWGIPTEVWQPVAEHHTQWQDPIQYTESELNAILTVQLADALALALGFESGFLDYFPQIPRDILPGCPGVRSVNPEVLGQTVREQMQEMKSMLGMFEENAPHRVAQDETAPPNIPPINYVTVEAPVVDCLGLWLQYGRGYSVRNHRLESWEGKPLLCPPVLVNLSGAEPQPARVARLQALLGAHAGLLVISEPWAEHISNVTSGWQVLSAPLALRHLDACLRKAGGVHASRGG